MPGGDADAPVVVEVVVDCDDDVDGPRWGAFLAAVLGREGVAPGAEAGLTFVAPSAMAELNREHMGGDGPTDVLSFPIDGLDAAGGADPGGPGLVGDVVVCPSVAHAAAAAHAGSHDDEIALLVVHGALHLLGHDHAEDDERALMQDRERVLLAELHGPLSGDPWGAG
jgi:probable rRNA maturation factor